MHITSVYTSIFKEDYTRDYKLAFIRCLTHSASNISVFLLILWYGRKCTWWLRVSPNFSNGGNNDSPAV